MSALLHVVNSSIKNQNKVYFLQSLFYAFIPPQLITGVNIKVLLRCLHRQMKLLDLVYYKPEEDKQTFHYQYL